LSPGLSQRLKHETWALHGALERSDLMRRLLRGRLEREQYCALLRSLYQIYLALESGIERHARHRAIAPVFFPQLHRAGALARDLDFLHGGDWRERLAVVPAASLYVRHLVQIDAHSPELLVAHGYVRFLGDLNGGQVLRRIVADSLRLDGGSGTAFYEFGSRDAVAALAQAYRAGLDSVDCGELSAAALVAEAKLAFQLHGMLFDELAATGPSGVISAR